MTRNIPIIFLTGYHSSGKTELGQMLSAKHKLCFIETGNLVRREYKNRKQEWNRLSIGEFVKEVEKESPGYFTKLLSSQVHEALADNEYLGVVINGMRALKYVKEFITEFRDYPSYTVWLNVQSDELLRQRYCKRENKEVSMAQFEEILKADRQLGIDELKMSADMTIENNGTLEELYSHGDHLMNGALREKLQERMIEMSRQKNSEIGKLDKR